jgi:hypothetical protein
MREVKLNRLDSELDTLTYPATRADVEAELGDVKLRYADGEEELLDVLERIEADVFTGSDDLRADLLNVLPVEAVGEPGQSEGEG